MEIDTCEKYVLAQLRDAQEQIASLELKVQELELERQAYIVERDALTKNLKLMPPDKDVNVPRRFILEVWDAPEERLDFDLLSSLTGLGGKDNG